MFRLNKFLIFIYFTVFFLFLLPHTISAATLFEDDFNDSDLTTSKWFVVGSGGWITNSGEYGILLNPGLSNSIPYDEKWNFAWTNIQFDVDLRGVQGVDKNILIKFIDTSNFLEIHANENGIYLDKASGSGGAGTLAFSPMILANNSSPYHFKIQIFNNTHIVVYLDNNLLFDVIETFPLTDWKIGLRAGTGGSPVTQVWFDNVVVTELPDEPEEDPLPVLTVPSLKQYQEPWKNKIYDHKNASIEKFGCALTSAAMVLQYHGHNIMPDTLNNWLKNQPDGYLKNGLLNWLAVSRYTKDNYSPLSRTLEYKRLDATNENLDNELNNNRPAILKEPGHFVVATGKTTDSYLINDPGYSDRTNLVPYENTFLKINSFTPTDSDLSYMMFVTNPNINLELSDSTSSAILIDSFIENPISNLLNPDKKSGNPVKVYLFEKPTTGKYVLRATGPKGNYYIDSYLYNTDGKVTKNNFEGKLNKNDTDTFNINYENKRKKSNFWFWRKHFPHFFDDRD